MASCVLWLRSQMERFWREAISAWLLRVQEWTNSTPTQPDGRILTAGLFTSVGGILRTNIARLQADGSVDPSWNSGAFGARTGAKQRTD